MIETMNFQENDLYKIKGVIRVWSFKPLREFNVETSRHSLIYVLEVACDSDIILYVDTLIKVFRIGHFVNKTINNEQCTCGNCDICDVRVYCDKCNVVSAMGMLHSGINNGSSTTP